MFPIVSPVTSLTGCWLFSRPPGFRDRTVSLPCHLLHFIRKGSYTVRISGREYRPGAGDMLYYYGCDSVEWIGRDSEVSFYSAGFTSRSLPVLSVLERWIPGRTSLEPGWTALWEACGSQKEGENLPGRPVNPFAALGSLMSILDVVYASERPHPAAGDSPWLKAERFVVENRNFRIPIPLLAEQAGCSEKGLSRSCREEFGLSPARRLKQLCMNEAMGLLLYSDRTITEIADLLGYPRIHEFSRDFRAARGQTPSVYRRLGGAS